MNIFTLSSKLCMSHLLLRDTFDSFSFLEGEIVTFNRFSIDGFLCPDFFDEPQERSHSLWKEVKSFCLELIRGSRPPVEFRLVLALSPADLEHFFSACSLSSREQENLQGLYLNFHFKEHVLTCTTGVSTRTFSLDRSLERAWDSYAETFLKSIPLELEKN